MYDDPGFDWQVPGGIEYACPVCEGVGVTEDACWTSTSRFAFTWTCPDCGYTERVDRLGGVVPLVWSEPIENFDPAAGLRPSSDDEPA